MSAYRFCRTDDIALLVDALNRCWHPWFPDEPAMTVAGFKREIRDLQVWCSSCMVAFAGSDPIGVLIGAKRASGTLVLRIAVHPDHRRQGHGRHLLTSLSSKLAILGPPVIVSELAGTTGPAHALFAACGFAREAAYTDVVLDTPKADTPRPELPSGRLIIPVSVDDLVANGLLSDADRRICWQRSIETLNARHGEIGGLAIATDERIEAFALYAPASDGTEIMAVRSDVADLGLRLRALLGRLIAQASPPLRIKKVHPDEIPTAVLESLGFRCRDVHVRYTSTARAA